MTFYKEPTHIEDYLVSLHKGQWFGWSDSKNKIYANLIIHPKIWDETYTGDGHHEGMIDNPYPKPTEKECEDGLAKMISDYNASEYQRDRKYPSVGDQLDMQYWDQVNGTTTWKDAIAKVKSDHPKP